MVNSPLQRGADNDIFYRSVGALSAEYLLPCLSATSVVGMRQSDNRKS
jgi:hypothetical protein